MYINHKKICYLKRFISLSNKFLTFERLCGDVLYFKYRGYRFSIEYDYSSDAEDVELTIITNKNNDQYYLWVSSLSLISKTEILKTIEYLIRHHKKNKAKLLTFDPNLIFNI